MQGPIQHPPAYCRDCHFLFPFGGVAIGVGGTVTVLVEPQLQCPRCNGHAVLLRGTYKAFQDRFDMFIDSNISNEAKLAVLGLIKDIQDNKISLQDAKDAAEKIDKRLSSLFDLSDWSDVARATLFSGIITAFSALTVAAATVFGPYLAPSPTVIVQSNFPPDFLDKLLSGISQLPFASPRYNVKPGEQEKVNYPSRDKRPKTSPKKDGRKKYEHGAG